MMQARIFAAFWVNETVTCVSPSISLTQILILASLRPSRVYLK